MDDKESKRARSQERSALYRARKADPAWAAAKIAEAAAPAPTSKECRICHETKPLDEEHFHRRSDTKNGFRGACRDCLRDSQADYYNQTANSPLREERKIARQLCNFEKQNR